MADKQRARKRNESKQRRESCERRAEEKGVQNEEISAKVGKGPVKAVKKDANGSKSAELSEAFHLFDFDSDGIISFSDLKKVYASLDRAETDDEQLKRMLAESSGPLDFEAFVRMMKCKTLDLDEEEVLVEALSQWDYGSGLISEERIKHDLMTWGDKFTEEEVEAALEHAPRILTEKKEKMINYVKFSNDLCGFRKARVLPNVE